MSASDNRFSTFVAHHGRKAVAHGLVGQLAMADALDHGGKSGIVGQVRLTQHVSA